MSNGNCRVFIVTYNMSDAVELGSSHAFFGRWGGRDFISHYHAEQYFFHL